MTMKTLVTRLSFLVLVLAILQVITTAAFPVELPPEILRLDAALAQNANIVYLGDSTLTLPVGEVTTGEVLQEMMPECTVAEIAHPAYNLDLYRYYVRHIVRSANRPRVIVVPVNMRSFSPEWDRRPGYQFAEEKAALTLGPLLSQVLWRPMQVFGGFESRISQEAFLDTPVYREETRIGTVRDFEQLTEGSEAEALQGDTEFAYHDVLPSADDEEALQQFLTYRYLSGLQPDHRQLKAMLDIAKMGQEHHVRILFYITPVNYQQGQRYVGESFREVVSKNADVVKSLLLDQTGIALVDLAFNLEAFAFVDMEHLRETGKEYVAVRLAAAIMPGLDLPLSYSGSQPTPTLTAVMDATPLPTVTAPPRPTRSVVAKPTLARVTVTPSPTATPMPAEEELPSGGALLGVEYLWRSPATGEYAVDVYRLQYETVDQEGDIANISAEVYVPYADTEIDFPLILHAAGTTGIGNGCAPLNERALERNWGRYDQHSLAYASQGYVVVLPNGLGFDDPDRIHPYFVAELEARTLLDAARAVYALAEQPSMEGGPIRPNETVFVMGYSSGGHAAFAVRDWAESYAPELSLQGVIGFGPTTNVETLLREDPVFAPYLVYAYRDFYGPEIIDVADVFAAQWVGTFESDVLTKCVDAIFAYYTRSPRTMYTPTFSEILYGGELEKVPLFASALAANASGLSGGHDVPVLILQGTADTVVTPDSQRAFRDQLCNLGDRVSYFEFTAVAHTDIRWSSFGDVLVWMEQATKGVPLPDSCEDTRPSE